MCVYIYIYIYIYVSHALGGTPGRAAALHRELRRLQGGRGRELRHITLIMLFILCYYC